jgi:hypothetical protein
MTNAGWEAAGQEARNRTGEAGVKEGQQGKQATGSSCKRLANGKQAALAAQSPLQCTHPQPPAHHPTHLDEGDRAGGLQEGEVSPSQGQRRGCHVDTRVAGQAQRAARAAAALQRARNLRAAVAGR